MTLAETYKNIFEEMCGTDDHNYKRIRHQLISSAIAIEVIGSGMVAYTLKDDSHLTLDTREGIKVTVR